MLVVNIHLYLSFSLSICLHICITNEPHNLVRVVDKVTLESVYSWFELYNSMPKLLDCKCPRKKKSFAHFHLYLKIIPLWKYIGRRVSAAEFLFQDGSVFIYSTYNENPIYRRRSSAQVFRFATYAPTPTLR